MIPCHGCALTQQAPVLFWPIIDAHDPSFKTVGARSPVRAALDVDVVSGVESLLKFL